MSVMRFRVLAEGAKFWWWNSRCSLCSSSSSSPQPKQLQLTLAVLKPDVCKQPFALKFVQNTIIRNRFLVVRSRHLVLSYDEAAKFYEEHKGKFFYDRLVNFMSSGPIRAYILSHHDAVARWRKLMGPTKVSKAVIEAPNTIRGTVGLSDTRNATHGSDSAESATREILFFFPNFDFDTWYKTQESAYRKRRVKFDVDKFVHVAIGDRTRHRDAD